MTAGPETPTEQPGWSAARVTILIVALCILIAGAVYLADRFHSPQRDRIAEKMKAGETPATQPK